MPKSPYAATVASSAYSTTGDNVCFTLQRDIRRHYRRAGALREVNENPRARAQGCRSFAEREDAASRRRAQDAVILVAREERLVIERRDAEEAFVDLGVHQGEALLRVDVRPDAELVPDLVGDDRPE